MNNKRYVTINIYTEKKSSPMLLQDLLLPVSLYSGKTAQIKENSQSIGRLAALMVEKGLLTLDEALAACGNTDKVIEVEV